MECGADGLETSLVTEPGAFFALEPEWRDLARDASDGSAGLGFAYAKVAWDEVAQPGGGALRVITVRRGGKLVCVWPLYVRREGRRLVARHLGAGPNEEYSGPLIRDVEDAGVVAAAALTVAKSLADALRLYNLRRPSPVTAAIEALPVFQDHQVLRSPIVSSSAFEDFDAWLATKSRNFRHSVRNASRRLAALGERRFTLLTPNDDVSGFVDWLLARKLALVDERGVARSWVRRPEARAFYKAILSLPSSETGVMAFVLTLDGRIVAGAICLLSDLMEYWITGYDDAFASYSPGSQLVEGLVRFAVDHRVDFDFRLTQDPHKRRWMDREEARATYELAPTMRGAPVVVAGKIRRVAKSGRRAAGRALRRLKLLR